MRHCVCIIEESVIAEGFHNFYVYVKTPPEQNDLPVLPEDITAGFTLKAAKEMLEGDDYKILAEAVPGLSNSNVLSLAEFVLFEFWAVDYLFYNPQGQFIRRQSYEMQLAQNIKKRRNHGPKTKTSY